MSKRPHLATKLWNVYLCQNTWSRVPLLPSILNHLFHQGSAESPLWPSKIQQPTSQDSSSTLFSSTHTHTDITLHADFHLLTWVYWHTLYVYHIVAKNERLVAMHVFILKGKLSKFLQWSYCLCWASAFVIALNHAFTETDLLSDDFLFMFIWLA